MIKATIQNSPYCTEIVFPCSETELSNKLGELGMEGGNKNIVKLRLMKQKYPRYAEQLYDKIVHSRKP